VHVIEARVDREGKTPKAGDGPVTSSEILLAWNARLEMLAERLFLLNRTRQALIDHVLETFVTVRSHGFLLRTATAALPDLDKSWKRQ
jgi:hypothetical protein